MILLLLLAFAPGAEALPARVKVKLFSAHATFNRIYLYGPVEILEPSRQTLPKGIFIIDAAGSGLNLNAASNHHRLLSHVGRIVLAGRAGAAGGSALGLAADPHTAPRLYKGTVSISKPDGRGLTLVNDVDTHSYITSCVGSEALPSFGAEALKAQAVLSTTLLENSAHKKLIDDSTEEQSYLGTTSERPEVKAAVDSVFGQELYFDGRPIDVFFCSTCGGTTSTPEIFGGPIKEGRYPYLKEVTCQFCRSSPFFKEHKEKISASRFYLSTGLKKPQITATHCGRPARISCEKNGRSLSVSGYQFWLLLGKHLGWGFVPSTCYQIDAGRAGDAGTIQFISRGCGHGVGLCQWGAAGQAQAGRGYKEILYFYFPGTSLKTPASRPVAYFRPSHRLPG